MQNKKAHWRLFLCGSVEVCVSIMLFSVNMGGRAYPVRHYPIAIRLRDRKGRAILCIALFPQSGDSSGAILGVRSVALLHSR